MQLHLAVSKHAISAILTREVNETQNPVYYASKVLHNVKIHYSPIEKLAYALIMATRKLRPYFMEHPIEVLTNYPLRQTLQKPNTLGRMVKWAIELGQFDIRYMLTFIKYQAFVAKFSNEPQEEPSQEAPWELFVDGSSIEARSGASVVLIILDWCLFCEALPFDFRTSNNEDKYEALTVQGDSQLVVNHVNGIYQVKEERMDGYFQVVRKKLKDFKSVQIKQIPRSQNSHVDALAHWPPAKE